MFSFDPTVIAEYASLAIPDDRIVADPHLVAPATATAAALRERPEGVNWQSVSEILRSCYPVPADVLQCNT
jgi:hypothetical protein